MMRAAHPKSQRCWGHCGFPAHIHGQSCTAGDTEHTAPELCQCMGNLSIPYEEKVQNEAIGDSSIT